MLSKEKTHTLYTLPISLFFHETCIFPLFLTLNLSPISLPSALYAFIPNLAHPTLLSLCHLSRKHKSRVQRLMVVVDLVVEVRWVSSNLSFLYLKCFFFLTAFLLCLFEFNYNLSCGLVLS